MIYWLLLGVAIWYFIGVIAVSRIEYKTFGTTKELWKQDPFIIAIIALLGPLLIFALYADIDDFTSDGDQDDETPL